MESEEIQLVKKYSKYAFIIFACFIVLFGTMRIVNAGERGILITLGKPSLEPRTEGLNFKIPLIQKLIKVDIKTQKYEAESGSASKDLQVVTTKIAVNYHLDGTYVAMLYKEVGLAYNERLIVPAVQEVVKASTAQFTAEELITKRSEVKEVIKELLRERLQSRGILIEDISITDFDFSESFNQAIEQKVTAEQLKLKAVNDLERIKVEAQQTIESAKAEAESLRLQKQEITPDLIQLRALEVQQQAIAKWDGKLPYVNGGGMMPFINLEGIIKA